MGAAEITWSWRARAVAGLLAAASGGSTVWAALDARTSAAVAVAGGALALVLAILALETCVFRVRVDGEGLRRRSLRGTDAIAWREVRGVRLFASRHEGFQIVHRRTDDFAAATHARLVPASGDRRPWDFNGWMRGFDGLLAYAQEHKLPALFDVESVDPPVVARTLRALNRANAIGLQMVAGFALFFTLFVAAVGVVAGLDVNVTGNILVDLGLVAVGILAVVLLIGEGATLLGVRRPASDEATPDELRVRGLMTAASLVGGVLLLIAFVPRALAGADAEVWVDWVLVAMGVLLVHGGLRG